MRVCAGIALSAITAPPTPTHAPGVRLLQFKECHRCCTHADTGVAHRAGPMSGQVRVVAMAVGTKPGERARGRDPAACVHCESRALRSVRPATQDRPSASTSPLSGCGCTAAPTMGARADGRTVAGRLFLAAMWPRIVSEARTREAAGRPRRPARGAVGGCTGGWSRRACTVSSRISHPRGGAGVGLCARTGKLRALEARNLVVPVFSPPSQHALERAGRACGARRTASERRGWAERGW